MADESCEVETVPVQYFVDAEFDDVSGVQRFGPVSNRTAADTLLTTLASRTDCKKATRIQEAI